jgi:2-dehydropantoate 2-reductase
VVKLDPLNALALTTAAPAAPIGAVRTHPRWRCCSRTRSTDRGGRPPRAPRATHAVLAELAELGPEQTSSLARDVAAGAEPELDAIGGAVLRAAARHGLACPAVAELVRRVAQRVR